MLTSIGGELWHGQAQNGVNFYFKVQFDHEGQGQSPQKTIGILTKAFYTSGPNLVMVAWMGDELSCRQAWGWHKQRHTDRQMQAMTIPGGQNLPWVKSANIH